MCFIIIISSMYDKMMVFIFVTEIETNNTNTTYGDGYYKSCTLIQ